MKPPILKKLVVEDFPADQRQSMGQLVQNINDLNDNIYRFTDRNVTINENLDAQVEVLTFYYRDVAPMSFPVLIKRKTRKIPQVCLVGQIVELASQNYQNPGPVVAPVQVSWQYNGNNQIVINGVSGLTANNSVPHYYQLTLLLM